MQICALGTINVGISYRDPTQSFMKGPRDACMLSNSETWSVGEWEFSSPEEEKEQFAQPIFPSVPFP